MTYWPFEIETLKTVSQALEIAEERTGDFYKYSLVQWKRHRYDVKTQCQLNEEEKVAPAFALLHKYTGSTLTDPPKSRAQDFYFICLQDHQILKALKRDKKLRLLPLLIYVFTHELVHIVRFCNFSERFEITGEGRDREEGIVHATTYDILKHFALPDMDYILKAYQGHRICDMALS
jgi:hypothetical protein